jgi:hypothetical protein
MLRFRLVGDLEVDPSRFGTPLAGGILVDQPGGAERMKTARHRLDGRSDASGGIFDRQRALSPNEIEEIEARQIRERKELIHLGHDEVADRVQP